MTTYEGGCLCGQVRYRVEGDPLMVAMCHCTHCQKQSGSVFSVNGVVPDAAFAQTGTTKVYSDSTDSGKPLERHFCADCGSPIASIAASIPGVVLVKAGTLDTPSAWVPSVEVYCDHAAAWLAASPDRRRIAQGS